MATVTGFTAARMQQIEADSIIDGDVDLNGNLILTKRGGSQINAGSVIGPKGDPGADAAPGSVAPTGNTTPVRTADGRVKTAAPTEADDSTTKDYVDTSLAPKATTTYVNTLVKGQDLGLNRDLNLVTEPGTYWQPTSSRATTALNYPTNVAGLLEVFTSEGSHIWQRYTLFGDQSHRLYHRAFYLSENYWSTWSLLTGAPESGWVNLTPASGWGSNPTATQRYCSARRVGPTVRFRGVINGTLNVNTTHIIATVPAALRPSSGSNACAVANSGGFTGWANVTDTGSLAVHFKSPWTSGAATIDITGMSYTLDG